MDLGTRCAALRAALRVTASLAVRPGALLRRGTGLVAELGTIGLGTSTVAPHGADGRFDGWWDDPVRRRAVQAYLATTGTLSGLLDDAALDPADDGRLRGALAALADLARPGGAGPGAVSPGPQTADPDPAGPVPGRDLAATPGAVVLRTPVFELIQYLPRTERVHDVPVLLVPPLAHRYYLADLAPGHSLVEHLVGEGLQVFALSWSDPDATDGRDLDTHAAAVLDAVEAATRVTRCPRVALAGLRTGGLLSAAVQCHLAATGRDDRIAAAVYLGTVLDQGWALPGFRPDPVPAAGGVLDGDAAVRSWSWRRGGEQVRPFAVDPAAAERVPRGPVRRALRHWATDLLHVPAALQAALLALATGDPDATVLGTPVAPGGLTRDAYLVTPADDPAQPWTAGLRTAQMLGGACRLVRADGDQAGALVAPDGYVAGPVSGDGEAPAGWQAAGERVDGSWWPDLVAWLTERAGPQREAPPELGGRRMYPVHPAPGIYLGG
ncbi:hypothetical protein [Pseudonocardia endophytica]|uniref:hypothetical protein n=1 Tax=Pseudonocardia endophytica TaxID=401976 RepID=UPI0014048A4C|nr:hypothetical protein [Pseudonocardia endophytica]